MIPCPIIRTVKSVPFRILASSKPNVWYTEKLNFTVDASTSEDKPHDESPKSLDASEKKKGGFAEAFKRHSSPVDEQPKRDGTFVSLLRNSKLIDLGDPQGKVVMGKIFHVVKDDLYIDFGWKFHCVCPRPAKNGSEYVRGAKVRIKIKELELSTRFLGSSRDLTLLEADAILLGIVSSPARVDDRSQQPT